MEPGVILERVKTTEVLGLPGRWETAAAVSGALAESVRFGLPDEIAKAVLFLAADGDYITGQQINVNGGVYM